MEIMLEIYYQHHSMRYDNNMRYLTLLSLIIVNHLSYAKTAEHCHPKINRHQSQFIVGYGSLMQEQSKREDAVHVDMSHPIYITGFQRGFIQHGTPIGFSTTYLAVVKQAASRMNAVYFKLNDVRHMDDYDRREDSYCRVSVSPQHIHTLTNDTLPEGQYWIYTIKNSEIDNPSRRYPIVQSYVDIFLSGCIALEEQYHLRGFALDCIKTTSNWSTHWVNDRVHPRTAFDNLPDVPKIDTLIVTALPYYFRRIKIEGG